MPQAAGVAGTAIGAEEMSGGLHRSPDRACVPGRLCWAVQEPTFSSRRRHGQYDGRVDGEQGHAAPPF